MAEINVEQLQARNNMLESDNRLFNEKLEKKEKEIKLLVKEIKAKNEDISDLKEITENRDIEVKRCTNCKHLCDTEFMSYVANEIVCESCRVNGYGR